MGEPVPPRPPPKAIDPRLRRWAQSPLAVLVGNWVKGALPGFLVSYRRGLEFAKFLTAHGRLFPLANLSHLPQADVYSPRQFYHICRRQMSIPPRQLITSAAGRCLFPLAINGEGVDDRPGVRSRATTKAYFHHSRKQTKWAKKILTNRKSSHI